MFCWTKDSDVSLICPKAKLKSLHEVVVRNRLEQLRKRQRDEALQAQKELFSGVAPYAGPSTHPQNRTNHGQTEIEESVPYDRSMSPEPIDITKLHYEDRQLDIILEKDDLRALVSRSPLLSSCTCS